MPDSLVIMSDDNLFSLVLIFLFSSMRLAEWPDEHQPTCNKEYYKRTMKEAGHVTYPVYSWLYNP